MIEALGIALPLGVIIGGFCYMYRVDAMVKIEQLRTKRARLQAGGEEQQQQQQQSERAGFWVSETITTRREYE